MLNIKKNAFAIFTSIYLLIIIFLITQVSPNITIFHVYQRYLWIVGVACAFSYLLIGPDIHTYIKDKQIVQNKILKIITLFIFNCIFLQLFTMYWIEKNHREAQVQKHIIEKIYENKGCHFTDITEPLERKVYPICLEEFGIKNFDPPKKLWIFFGYHALGVKIIKIQE